MSKLSKLVQAQALMEKGTYEKALSLLEEHLNSLETTEIIERVNTLNMKSRVLWRAGNHEEANLIALDALELAHQSSGHLSGQGDALNNLGLVCWQLGELDQAEDYFQKSLELRQKLGILKDIAASFNSLGTVYWHRGELDQAEKHFQQSLVIRKELGNPQDIARCLNNLGNVCYQHGELDRAEKYHQQSLMLKEKLGNSQDISLSFDKMGAVSLKRGELSNA